MIRLNEEIDQVIKLLDDVVGSYSKGNSDIDGLSTGAAAEFHRSVTNGQGNVNAAFRKLDTKLKALTEAIRASVADQRAADDQADERLRVHLNELAMAEDGTAREGTRQVVEADTKVPGINTSGRPDGSQ